MAYNREYITEFDTTAEFASFSGTSQCLKPHVSLTNDNGVVHFIKEDYRGHPYVEIGGLKWSTMNLNAVDVDEYGTFFQWGDISGYTEESIISGQKRFTWRDYKYTSGITAPSESDLSAYNPTDGKTVLSGYNDAAVKRWGGKWRMPTAAEFEALINATTTEWTSNYKDSGVAGLILTDKTNSSKKLFFPAAGYFVDDNWNGEGSLVKYWSSSVNTDDYLTAFPADANGSSFTINSEEQRYYGCPIRPVAD